MKSEILKANPAFRSFLCYVVQQVTGQHEFSDSVELDFRNGGLRGGRPTLPLDLNRKEIGVPFKPYLPSIEFTGKVVIGANLGNVNHLEIIEKSELVSKQ